MNIQTSDGKSRGQLYEEISEALADTGTPEPVGYWPALPFPAPSEPKARRRTTKKASPSTPKKPRKKTAARKGAKKKTRTKARARPQKKTIRRASSRKPRARSTRKRVAKRKSSKKSKTTKKKARATMASAATPSRGDLLSRVRTVVQHMGPGGRFGDKVFISEIYDEANTGMTMPEFKRWLVDQNRERTLNLARADLIGAMDPGQVSRSEIVDMGSSFHFVRDPHHRYG